MTVHPLLAAIARTLQEAGVRWCLLRLPANPAAPDGDIDLLLDRRDARRVRDLLLPLGVVPIPGWDAPPVMLFLGYHGPTDRWLTLEIITELSFGPGGIYGTAEVAGCLARRVGHAPLPLLAPDDAFWALLLHCLLEKGRIAEHHRARMQALAACARADSPLALVVSAACPPGRGPSWLLERAQRREWGLLEGAAPALASTWCARRRAGVRLRARTRHLQRLARGVRAAPRRRGASVALLGPNGAGKTTLTAEIARTFPFPVRTIYMGLWKDHRGRRTRWAAGMEIGVRPLRIWRRYLLARYHQSRGRLVVFDRYTYDALRPPAAPFVVPKRLYFWLLAHACPAPDLVLVLDVPAAVTYARKGENGLEQLAVEQREFRDLLRRLPRLQAIDASASRERVRADATARIWAVYVARWGAARRPPTQSLPSVLGHPGRGET